MKVAVVKTESVLERGGREVDCSEMSRGVKAWTLYPEAIIPPNAVASIPVYAFERQALDQLRGRVRFAGERADQSHHFLGETLKRVSWLLAPETLEGVARMRVLQGTIVKKKTLMPRRAIKITKSTSKLVFFLFSRGGHHQASPPEHLAICVGQISENM